jgi:predicted nucleic acid-binding protein
VLAISEWALIEFASAMSLKVRINQLQPDQARSAQSLIEKLAAESLQVHTPTRADYVLANAFLGQYSLALRAGDALHLATEQNEGAEAVFSLDRLFVATGRKLKIKTQRPIRR